MLLSICIPTYNRVDYLKEMVGSIVQQITQYELFDEIEVVVSDNHSTDRTAAYLSGLKDQYPRVRFQLNRNPENLGFIRNLLKIIDIVGAKYWWFIGDDDDIPKDALPKIIEELKAHSEIPVFIFNQSAGYPIAKSANISIQECTENYYYYMGNAVTICNTELCRKILAEDYYENCISTCWPQTYLFFMSMYLSKQALPVRVSTIEAFKFNVQNNTNSAYYYFDAQFFSLFRLGYSLAADSNNPSFIDWFPRGIPFIHGVKNHSWVFNINKEYRFFDFDNERKEFEITYKEAEEKLLPAHQKHFRLFKIYRQLPDFVFKYYSLLYKSAYLVAYNLFKRKKIVNPFALYKTELIAFNNFKEEKLRRKQLKYMHSTGKNDW